MSEAGSTAASPGSRRFLIGKAIAIAIFLLLAAYLIIRPAEQLPTSAANGTYSTSCCGSLVLRDGTMQVGQETVSYKIERDKGGAYVMPRYYVSVDNGDHFSVEHRLNPLKIRMSGETAPASLELMTAEAVYTLQRQ